MGIRDRAEAEAEESTTQVTAAAPKVEEPDPNGVEISASSKGLVIKTRDDKFKFAFGGRIQLDAAVFEEDDTNLGDGTEMRRARIKSYGTLWDDWDYKLEVNFDSDSSVDVTDGWLRHIHF